MISLRNRYILFTFIALLSVLFSTYYWRMELTYSSTSIIKEIQENLPLVQDQDPVPALPKKYQPKYKPEQPATSYPIVDNFPLAAAAHSSAELPPISSWSQPPTEHVPESTPLFIGFTRNWRLLQQVVVSYITAGWPPEDIYVVENTGVMDSNKHGRLSLQNPFFLNHTRLNMLGVNVLITPTLLTFAQLQNFYLWHSIQREWNHYFWSHMDVAVLPFEDHYYTDNKPILPPSDPNHDYSDFQSLYMNCVKQLRNNTIPDPDTGLIPRWAMSFFSYDRLALVNVNAFIEVGGWDTLIPFYMTDCDMHARLEMAKFEIKEVFPGMVFDVASSMDDLIVLYRKKGTVEVSFKDPNMIEEELKAISKTEKELEGFGLVSDNVKRSKSRMEGEEKDEAKAKEVETNKEAWDEFAAGTSSAAGKESTTEVETSSSKWEEDDIFSESFQKIVRTLDRMQASKAENSRGRNTWQARQTGGFGEPFYRDSAGFDIGIQMTIEHGRAVFSEKWGHRDCDIAPIGLKPEDAWKVQHDWD